MLAGNVVSPFNSTITCSCNPAAFADTPIQPSLSSLGTSDGGESSSAAATTESSGEAEHSNTVIEGELFRKGMLKWKRRWVCLTGNALAYFETSDVRPRVERCLCCCCGDVWERSWTKRI